MLFESFDVYKFHFKIKLSSPRSKRHKEHDNQTILSRDQATSNFKRHVFSNALRHKSCDYG